MESPPIPVGRQAAGGLVARRARLPLALALLLALLVVGSAVASLLVPPQGPPRAPWLFPPEARTRVDALRDRLVAGLLSLQRRDGLFTAQPDGGFSDDPLDDTETTGIALAALGAARRMGANHPDLASAISRARAALVIRQRPDGGFGQSGKPGRGATVAAVAAGVLGLGLDGDPRLAPAFDLAARRLVDLATLGPLPGGWVQGIAVRAMVEAVEEGHGGALGADPAAAIPTVAIGERRDAGYPRLSEAFAQAVLRRWGGTSSVPGEVFSSLMVHPPVWDGPRSDFNGWILGAWLAARVPGGTAWYAAALPALETGIAADGTIPWEAYGSPAGKTAFALLILWEGSGSRPAEAP